MNLAFEILLDNNTLEKFQASAESITEAWHPMLKVATSS